MSVLAIYKTACTLCGKSFTAQGVDAPIVDGKIAPPSARSQKMVNALVEHFTKAHSLQIVQQSSAQFAGWLILRQFNTEDPNLALARDITRRDIHNITAARNATDEQIAARLESVTKEKGLTPEIALALLLELRDALTETGSHAPGHSLP